MCNIVPSRLLYPQVREPSKNWDEDLLKGIVGGVKKDEHEVQVVGELHLELKVHDEPCDEPSCEASDTSTFASQIVDKPCDELELVHSSSPIVGIQTVMTGEIHEVQGNEHNTRDNEQSHMEVRESLYIHEIELPNDSH